MDAALAGLLGAFIGGTLTSGSTLTAEWLRARAAREQRQADQDLLFTQATRLASEEMLEALYVLEDAAEEHRWWTDSKPLMLERWEEHAPVVALGLADRWSYVSGAVVETRRIARELIGDRAAGDQPDFDSATLRRVMIVHDELGNAINTLRDALGLHELALDLWPDRRLYRQGQMLLPIREDGRVEPHSF